MLSLTDKKVVIKKEFVPSKPGGRTRVLYWANQDSTAKETQAALRQDDNDGSSGPATPEAMERARQELVSLRQQTADQMSELEAVLKTPANSELPGQIQKAQDQLESMRAVLHETKERIAAAEKEDDDNTGSARVVGIAATTFRRKKKRRERCPRKLKMKINSIRNQWKDRREKCTDFVDQLADAMEKRVKDVVKLLDVETDEMAKATLPPKYIL